MKQRNTLILALLVVCLAVVLYLAPQVGTGGSHLDWISGYGGGPALSSSDHFIFFSLRLPRMVLAVIAGVALAISGLLYQTLFQNCLASEYTLGVSSGAFVGVAVALMLSSAQLSSLFALLGGLVPLVILIGWMRVQRWSALVDILLVGMALNILLSGFAVLILALSTPSAVLQLTAWTLGSLDVVEWTIIGPVAIAVVALTAPLALMTTQLDLLAVGTQFAQSKGLATKTYSLYFLVVATLLVAVVVSCCGVIPLVGLLVPNMARRLFGPAARWLLPGTWLLGALLLPLADTLLKLGGRPDLPIGAVTAVVGGILLLGLLRRG